MNHMNNITPQKKHKHLTEEHLKYIEKEINYFNATKAKGAVAFKKELARKIGTSISNLYRIINECTVSILNYDLSTRKEFVANIIINSARGPSNNSKLVKAESFINDVITEFKMWIICLQLMKSSCIRKFMSQTVTMKQYAQKHSTTTFIKDQFKSSPLIVL